MAKWDMKFSEADARKVAEKLFPHDAPPWGGQCPPDCKWCAECKEAWEAQVNNVWEALKVLEGEN